MLLFILLEINSLPTPVFIASDLILGCLWLYFAIKEMRKQGKRWYKQPEILLTIVLFLALPTKYRYASFQPFPTIFLIAMLALSAIVFKKRHEMYYGPDDLDSNDA